ncbi:MAG: hypothetical protein K2O38_04275 [Muribaculaceae bacterium]|nr:hypothetical protein [Muribaculaceae bacterium]
MINPKLIFLLLVGIATLCWACKPSDTADRTAEEIATAMEHGRYESAQSLADKMLKSRNAELDTMRVERLCILAVSMARLGDHAEHGDEYTAFALKCFRQALLRNPVQTQAYIREMSSDDYRYISFLNQLMRPMDAREAGIVYSINEEGEDSTVDSIPTSENDHTYGSN